MPYSEDVYCNAYFININMPDEIFFISLSFFLLMSSFTKIKINVNSTTMNKKCKFNIFVRKKSFLQQEEES